MGEKRRKQSGIAQLGLPGPPLGRGCFLLHLSLLCAREREEVWALVSRIPARVSEKRVAQRALPAWHVLVCSCEREMPVPCTLSPLGQREHGSGGVSIDLNSKHHPSAHPTAAGTTWYTSGRSVLHSPVQLSSIEDTALQGRTHRASPCLCASVPQYPGSTQWDLTAASLAPLSCNTNSAHIWILCCCDISIHWCVIAVLPTNVNACHSPFQAPMLSDITGSQIHPHEI